MPFVTDWSSRENSKGIFCILSITWSPSSTGKKTVLQLFEPKGAADQELFYANKWNTWRWKLLFRIFFSRTVMGRYGRDQKFFTEVGGNVAKTIYERAQNHLKSTQVFKNELVGIDIVQHFFVVLIITKKTQLLKSIHGVGRKTHGSYLYPVSVYGCYLLGVVYNNMPNDLKTITDHQEFLEHYQEMINNLYPVERHPLLLSQGIDPDHYKESYVVFRGSEPVACLSLYSNRFAAYGHVDCGCIGNYECIAVIGRVSLCL